MFLSETTKNMPMPMSKKCGSFSIESIIGSSKEAHDAAIEVATDLSSSSKRKSSCITDESQKDAGDAITSVQVHHCNNTAGNTQNCNFEKLKNSFEVIIEPIEATNLKISDSQQQKTKQDEMLSGLPSPSQDKNNCLSNSACSNYVRSSLDLGHCIEPTTSAPSAAPAVKVTSTNSRLSTKRIAQEGQSPVLKGSVYQHFRLLPYHYQPTLYSSQPDLRPYSAVHQQQMSALQVAQDKLEHFKYELTLSSQQVQQKQQIGCLPNRHPQDITRRLLAADYSADPMASPRFGFEQLSHTDYLQVGLPPFYAKQNGSAGLLPVLQFNNEPSPSPYFVNHKIAPAWFPAPSSQDSVSPANTLATNPFYDRGLPVSYANMLFAHHHHQLRKPKRVRTAFSPSQLLRLEHAFERNHYVVGLERKQIASSLSLTETQVKVWFQNRRTKHKRVRVDDDCSQQDSRHDEDEENEEESDTDDGPQDVHCDSDATSHVFCNLDDSRPCENKTIVM